MGILLNDKELPLFDSIAAEVTRLSGVQVRLWVLNRGGSRDPLWDEPSKQYGYDPLYGERGEQGTHPAPVTDEWVFDGPFEFWAVVEYEETGGAGGKDTAIEESLSTTSEAAMHTPRVTFDDGKIPYPKIGDVLEIPSWKDKNGEIMYFDVTGADRAGALNDSQSYVQFVCTLTRRSKFEAERRIAGQAHAADVE